MIQIQACVNALNSLFLFLLKTPGVELCPQQNHHQSLWTDSKALPTWGNSEQLSLAGKQGGNSLSDWLGLNAVDDRIEHRRHEEVDARH